MENKEYTVKIKLGDVKLNIATDNRRLARAMVEIATENSEMEVDVTRIPKPKAVKFAKL